MATNKGLETQGKSKKEKAVTKHESKNMPIMHENLFTEITNFSIFGNAQNFIPLKNLYAEGMEKNMAILAKYHSNYG